MKTRKIFDLIEFVTSIIVTLLLLVVLWYSLDFWNEFYRANIAVIKLNMLMFYVGVLIAVVTVLAQWIQGRIIAIIRSWNILRSKGGVCGKKTRTCRNSFNRNSNSNNSRL